MLERFTERARRVVVLAHEEARALKHNYLGTEHILLGLLREEKGLAAIVLASLDITVERVRAQVVRIVGSGDEVAADQIPFTPRATKVLKLALDEALRLGEDHIGTEHILLGLVCENEGVAARILLDLEADPERIREEIIGRPPAELGTDPGVGDFPASGPELGWRRRPIVQAALGAAVLARRVFDPARTGHLQPLEMQVLAHLMTVPPTTTADPPGEPVDSLAAALACAHADVRHALENLCDRLLISREDEDRDQERVSITAGGVRVFERWLASSAPLFGSWPPDHPAADDATG